MNRAERRRQMKLQGKAEKSYNLKDKDIAKMKNEATVEAVDRAFMMILAFALIAIRDVFGFGKKRLGLVFDKIMNLYDSYNKGYFTFSDVINTLKEEADIDEIISQRKDVKQVWDICTERNV